MDRTSTLLRSTAAEVPPQAEAEGQARLAAPVQPGEQGRLGGNVLDAGNGVGATTTGGGASGSAGTGAGGVKGCRRPMGRSPGFWDAGNIPPATNVMTFKFLNRTNGKYQDSEVFWSFKTATGTEVHSIAEQPLYDMPANSSGRMYFYLGAPQSMYFDFIEFTIGPTRFNGNTTRVDAFGLKIATRLHCADGFDVAVGEDYSTFLEDRAVTFQKFLDEVPDEFKPLAQIQAPYRIVQPGAGDFKTGGTYEHYYDADFVQIIWGPHFLTIPQGNHPFRVLGTSTPTFPHAIFRRRRAPSFPPPGPLNKKNLWANSSSFSGPPPPNLTPRFRAPPPPPPKSLGFFPSCRGGGFWYVSQLPPPAILPIFSLLSAAGPPRPATGRLGFAPLPRSGRPERWAGPNRAARRPPSRRGGGCSR